MAKILPFPAVCPAICPDGTVRPLPFDLDQQYHFSIGPAIKSLAEYKKIQQKTDRPVVRALQWIRSAIGQ